MSGLLAVPDLLLQVVQPLIAQSQWLAYERCSCCAGVALSAEVRGLTIQDLTDFEKVRLAHYDL